MNRRNLAIIVVVALIAVAALIWGTAGGNSALTKYDSVLVGQSFASRLSVPDAVLAQVGIGASGNFPSKLTKTPLTLNGKPAIIYIGSEYCPYCAAERWPMIIALSRFGTFGNLRYMTSSPTDVAPSTPTFTFYNSTYQSSYITFVAREMQTNMMVNGTYPTLQTLNATESNMIATLDQGGGIPFINFANRSVLSGATYSPLILQNMNWSQIMAQIYVTNSTLSQSILGSANLLTAQICRATNNTPADVCMQSYIQKIEAFA
ncbi:MAG: DUF929 family protein [Candidatus Micrarchaeota archaeon]|nr:DUF929 family protein [Candidatus Micrarchaeota archaeon]